MSWKSLAGWLVLVALLLVAISNRSARRQQSRAVSLLSPEPFAGTGGADDPAANKFFFFFSYKLFFGSMVEGGERG